MTEALTIILPFFNEQGWVGHTVASLAAQSDQRFKLILVDNGSTDNGAEEAALTAKALGERASLLSCPAPGKIEALAVGLAQVETTLVATCDADTFYPPDYVRNILDLFGDEPQVAAVIAIDLYKAFEDRKSKRRGATILHKSRRFPHKCHAGGCGQAFRTDALRAAGGFDAARWPYVLEDHEIIHRVMCHGEVRYHADHVCYPSDRRASRKGLSWTRTERLLYRYLPRAAMDWYFYSFLGRRLAARNCMAIALRQRDWYSAPA